MTTLERQEVIHLTRPVWITLIIAVAMIVVLSAVSKTLHEKQQEVTHHDSSSRG